MQGGFGVTSVSHLYGYQKQQICKQEVCEPQITVQNSEATFSLSAWNPSTTAHSV